jgi:hypothetical protein
MVSSKRRCFRRHGVRETFVIVSFTDLYVEKARQDDVELK